MHITLKKKTVEEIIGYWIEMEHIQREIAAIMEYSDEVGEFYEFSTWLKGNVGVGGNSVIDVRDSLEQVDTLAFKVMSEAEEKLKVVLKSAIENNDEMFAQYENTKLLDKIDDLIICLTEDFDEIYDYEQKVQIENFYKVMHKCIKEII